MLHILMTTLYIGGQAKESIMTTKVYFKEDDDIIEICKDNVFKAVFTKDTQASRIALSKLVSALIGREVSIIDILANEPPIDNIRDRQIRFDINCRAENGELVNVEMCFNPNPFEPVRLEFQTGKLFVGQDIRGKEKDFNDLKRTYQIAILAKEKFFSDDVIYHTFEYYDPDNNVFLNGKTRIITLELSKVSKIADKSINEMNIQELWAIFFRYLTDKTKRNIINKIVEREEGIAMASEVVMRISRDEEERARLLRDEMIELDWQSSMVIAKREGIKEGERIGESRGEKKQNRFVLDLIDQGLSTEEIKQRLEQQ